MKYLRTACVLLTTIMASLAIVWLVLALMAVMSVFQSVSRNRTVAASVLGALVLVLFIVLVITRA